MQSPLAGPRRRRDRHGGGAREHRRRIRAGGRLRLSWRSPRKWPSRLSVFTRRGVERIVRFAFELAVKRNKKKRVTSITKSNAQGFSMVLWDRIFQDVARQFPEHRDRIAAGGRRRHEFHPPAGELRRGGGLQPVRRYPERYLGHHRRQHGPRGQRQSRSAAPLPFHVRAGARFGAGYRRQGRSQSRWRPS